MTEDTQLTALQAADLLAVSPAFVTKLLEDGVIPRLGEVQRPLVLPISQTKRS